VAFQNAAILQERGYQVEVFTGEFAGREPMDYPFPVHFLPCLFRLGNAPCTPSLFWRLKGFDRIHLHYPYIFGAEFAGLASRAWHIPILMSYHNRLIQSGGGLKSALLKTYNLICEPAIARQATRIAAVSSDHLRSLRLPPALLLKEFEIPNGVDASFFCPGDQLESRRQVGLPAAAYVVLFVGALDSAHRFKNVPMLIEAVARIDPGATLVVAGGGDLLPEMKEAASRSAAANRVLFTGSLTPDQLLPYYRAADVTVLPSLEVESFGLVLIESMACATPVIATSLPGVRTVIDDGVNGILVSPGSLDQLTLALNQIRSDSVGSREMGRLGRLKVERRYAWSVVAESLEAAIRG